MLRFGLMLGIVIGLSGAIIYGVLLEHITLILLLLFLIDLRLSDRRKGGDA